MQELMNRVGETGQDNLIAGVFPPAEITGIKIAAGQGQLRLPAAAEDGPQKDHRGAHLPH